MIITLPYSFVCLAIPNLIAANRPASGTSQLINLLIK